VSTASEASLNRAETSSNKPVSSISSLTTTAASETSVDHSSAQDDRERLTFHIALGESGFASLGISVTKVFRNRRDCGIFIKSVRIGGMAAKVCQPAVCLLEHCFALKVHGHQNLLTRFLKEQNFLIILTVTLAPSILSTRRNCICNRRSAKMMQKMCHHDAPGDVIGLFYGHHEY